MNKSVSVDVYGKCSENTTQIIPRDSKEEKELLAQYKFYIAFENSKCPEYVTEKLYKIIHSPSNDNPPVPVVMGPNRSWYEENLPAKSFIHVDEYSSPEKLGAYLKSLDSQDKSYFEYLNWRRYHKRACEPKVRCKLCDVLLKSRYNSYKDILQSNKSEFIISDFGAYWKRFQCEDSMKSLQPH